jgi:hypothetical protein
LQPSAQLSQQPQSQLQSGQFLQQSSEQQLPPSQQPPAPEVGAALAPLKNRPETIAREPNNLVNIWKLAFCVGQVFQPDVIF